MVTRAPDVTVTWWTRNTEEPASVKNGCSLQLNDNAFYCAAAADICVSGIERKKSSAIATRKIFLVNYLDWAI